MLILLRDCTIVNGGRRSRNSERRRSEEEGNNYLLTITHGLQIVTLKNIPLVEGRWPGGCAVHYTRYLNTSSSLEAEILALAHCSGSPNYS